MAYTKEQLEAAKQRALAAGDAEAAQAIERAQSQSIGNMVADVGLEIGAETIGGAAGGLLGSGLGPFGMAGGAALGAGIFNRLYDVYRDIRGFPERSAADQGVGFLGSMLGAGPGPKVGQMGSLAARRGLQALTPGFGPESVSRLNELTAAGIPPSIGAVSPKQFPQAMQQGMREMPFTGNIIEDYAGKVEDAASSGLDEIAKTRAGEVVADPYQAGTALQRGARTQVDRFFNKAEAARRARAGLIDPQTPVPSSNYIEEVLGARGVWGNRANLAQSNMPAGMSRRVEGLKDLAKYSEDGQIIGWEPLTWAQADMMRRQIGRRLASPSFTEDIDTTSLKRLYGAVSRDMEAALENASPEVKKLWSQEKRFFRRGIDKAMAAQKELVDKKVPEQIASMLTGKPSYSKVMGLRRKTTPEAWDMARSYAAQKLGEAKASVQNVEQDVFSPDTFMTNYANMSDATKNALFGSYKGLPNMRKDLDILARAVGNVKEAGAFRNYSGTARMNRIMQLLSDSPTTALGAGAFLAGFEGTGAALAGVPLASRQLAKAFVSPEFVRWLAKVSKPTINEKGFATLVGQLPGLALANPEIQEIITGLHEGLKE